MEDTLKSIQPAAYALLDACPFPEPEGGRRHTGYAIVRPWQTPECSGDLEVYPTPFTPKAAVHFDTALRTVLRAAAAAWPQTVHPAPDGPDGPVTDLLGTLVPAAEHLAREVLRGWDVPTVRMWFRPDDAHFVDLWVTLPAQLRDLDARVSGGMCGRDMDAIATFLNALHH